MTPPRPISPLDLRAATGPKKTSAVRHHLCYISGDVSVRGSLRAVAAAVDVREAARGALQLRQVKRRL